MLSYLNLRSVGTFGEMVSWHPGLVKDICDQKEGLMELPTDMCIFDTDFGSEEVQYTKFIIQYFKPWSNLSTSKISL